jgi:hypothetical protein
MLLMVAEDGFEPPTRVLDDLAMERLDDMRTSLETDATDPPGLALVRAPVGLLSQQTGCGCFRRRQPAGRRRAVNNAWCPPCRGSLLGGGSFAQRFLARCAHVGEMTLHAGFYSAAAKLDVRAMLLDVRSARPGHRNELYHGSLAIR